MSLNEGWTNHLLSTRSAIHGAVSGIERIAVQGQSPSGMVGQPLTCLSTTHWMYLRQGLAEVVNCVENLVESLDPADARRARERQSFSATRYHLAIALTMLEETVVDDLDPSQVSGFGTLDPETTVRLSEATASMRATVSHLREYVQSLTEP